MKTKELAKAGMKVGPGGHTCSCCRLPKNRAQIHRQLRRKEREAIKKDI